MHICIAAPIACADLAPYLDDRGAGLPAGYTGAPLTAVLIAELLRLGHQVHALTVDYESRLTKSVRAQGHNLICEVLPGRPRVWRREHGRPGRALDLFRDERRAIAGAIIAARPDIVHAHWTYEFALGAIESKLPHIITVHDSPRQVARHTRSVYRLLRWWMASQALRQADALTAVSSYVASEVRAMARVPIRLVPNPIASGAFELGSSRLAARGQRVCMVCNGWAALKNPQVALRAFAQLRLQLPDAELHLMGTDFGPGERAAQWAAGQGLADGVHFVGRLPHTELLRRMASMDVLLHTAHEESFGVVIAEAMALGLPVVAGRHSGAVPWVAGAGQWLVDVRHAPSIAQALRDALCDASAYAAASSAARREARRFEAQVVAQAYLSAYAQALQEPLQ